MLEILREFLAVLVVTVECRVVRPVLRRIFRHRLWKMLLIMKYSGSPKAALFMPTNHHSSRCSFAAGYILPQTSRLASRKYWIANTLRPRGRLIIDDGAKKALLDKGKSLLPSGIVAVEGEFSTGDPVNCVDSEGNLLAKGLVNYSASDIRKIMGLKTPQILPVLGHKDYDEVIHRDNLVVTNDIKKNRG